jgi:hypothetical protein
MPTNPGRATWPMLPVLLLLLGGCGSVSRITSDVPSLPQEARQPQTPAWCTPSCSGALMRDYDNSLNSPTSAEPPERPASGLIGP